MDEWVIPQNDIVLLQDKKTLMCIMRKDGGDGHVHPGHHGPHVPYLIATSTDMDHWVLREAPSYMLSARPRAVALANGAIIVAGGRPALNFCAHNQPAAVNFLTKSVLLS